MFCKECGTELSDDAKFCIKCGLGMERNNTEYMNESVSNFEQEQIEKIDFDERFIKAYIGNKADKMYSRVKNVDVNIYAVLFGLPYFIYRKMYLITTYIILIGFIIRRLIPGLGVLRLLIRPLIGILIGLMFYPLYKWDITRKLRKIRADNPNANEKQLLDIAKNKGGTSVIGGITVFILFILNFIIYFNVFYYVFYSLFIR